MAAYSMHKPCCKGISARHAGDKSRLEGAYSFVPVRLMPWIK